MLDHMKVFNEYIMPATIETLAQMIDKFNAASNGTMRLTAEGFTGDFWQESFFQTLASSRRRVERYGSNDAVSATNLQELQRNGVKVAGGFGPIVYEPSQMSWLNRPTVQGVEKASQALAELILQDQLNTAVAALVAAIQNQATATNDVSGSSSATYVAMNGAHALFGDNSGSIVATVMDGATFHKLVEGNLTNTERLFREGTVQVVDILGRAMVVTDAPGLYQAGTPNKSLMLGLVEGAATVFDPGDVITNVETSNGKERIETSFQADYTFGLALKGYSWDQTNGGKSPDDAAIATGSNWDKVATDIKHTAGVAAVVEA